MVKYVFVTGGVVSGLGKGITAASLGTEIQWTLPEHKNFDRFMERLPEMLKIYSDLGYGYRKDVFAADTVAVKQ